MTAPNESMHTHAVQPRVPSRLPAWCFLAALLLLAGLVVVDRFVLRSALLTPFRGTPAASPLYAFWNPIVRPEALVFVLGAALVAVLAPRLAEPERASRTRFLAALAACAVLLPLALFLVRQDLGELGSQFTIYRDEEFWFDALRIPLMSDAQGRSGVPVFLAHYVEVMPRLSLHGQHFPPGHALFLRAVASASGDSLQAAGAAVLAAAALGVIAAYGALRELLDERAARQGALFLVALPPYLDFACTSMDAVFFLGSSLALWAALRALRADAWLVSALVAGLAFALAALASFAVLPLGLVVALYAVVLVVRKERAPAPVARALLGLAVGFVAGLGLVWLATGFAWWTCLLHARESGLALMTRVLKGPPSSRWLELSFGNAAAFAVGVGVAAAALGLARLVPPARRVPGRAYESWTIAVGLAFLALAFGGLFFLETERIWLFLLPPFVGAALPREGVSRGGLALLLGTSFLHALLLEVLLFTLW